jgi:hypothetical protein
MMTPFPIMFCARVLLLVYIFFYFSLRILISDNFNFVLRLLLV